MGACKTRFRFAHSDQRGDRSCTDVVRPLLEAASARTALMSRDIVLRVAAGILERVSQSAAETGAMATAARASATWNLRPMTTNGLRLSVAFKARELSMRKIGPTAVTLLEGWTVSSGLSPAAAARDRQRAYHEGGRESFVGSLMYEGGCLLFDGETAPRDCYRSRQSARSRGVARGLPPTAKRPTVGDRRGDPAGRRVERLGRARSALFAPFQQQCGPANPSSSRVSPRQLSFATKDYP